MLKNENSEEYEIEVKDISVAAVGDEEDEDGNKYTSPGDVKRRPQLPYDIKPQEELPVRVEWAIIGDDPNPLPECTNSIEFHTNITSIQKSGGGSAKYGLVPQEEGYLNFLHFFDPEIETNPGPLDIYVFTDPYAVNVEWYSIEGFVIIIKIKNKAEGTAFLDNITLVQTFDTPWKYFYFDSPCYDEEGIQFPLDTRYMEGECSGVDNCYTLDFVSAYGNNKGLNLTEGETKEIVCAAMFQDGISTDIDELVGTYTDLISVFTPSYEFLQEFKETKIAECAATEAIMLTCANQGNTKCPSPYDSYNCCCYCYDDKPDQLTNSIGEGSSVGCSDNKCGLTISLEPEDCFCP